ncbi:MAG: branched-chain amino acid ABC transporter substrate-binding protein [Phototrophicales bacterium]|nr:MAG: branched-chain amino acid ABC transporter substrate-binding protein [Phototrophicales bacterium]
MMKKRFLVIVITVAILLVSVGPSYSPVSLTAQSDEPIKIGAIFDLTGPTSDVGQLYAAGIVAYVDYVNANGGIEGRPIELLSQDYAYSVENAENLYIEYVNEGVVAFQGWGTGDTEALRGRIAEDEIPFMSASYSAPLGDPEEAPYNFLVGTTYSDQLVILLQFMLEEWEAEGFTAEEMKVAVFHNDSPFGTSPLADGQAWGEEVGVEVYGVPMPRGASSFDAEITTHIVEGGATHVVVQNTSGPAALLLRNLEDLGLRDFVVFGCLNWCADEILIEGAGEAAEGVLGALPFAPTSVEVPGQEVVREWLAENDDRTLEEASLHFTQGWWTMAVMVEGIRLTLANGQELTGANIRANLETLENFDTGGITAPLTYTSEDHRGNRALRVYRVEDGVWVQASDLIDLRAEDMEEMSE